MNCIKHKVYAHRLTSDRVLFPRAQTMIAQKVCMGVFKGVTTKELDELAAETAASMTSKHPDYSQVRDYAFSSHFARPSMRQTRRRPSSCVYACSWNDPDARVQSD